ncbi:LuxR C-terminal-related transcriptional regulator [Amycolatopsis sp. 195334CR]|uniref:LuxR C-terminal-related transcriptional regulator n=1 Tax=Amycolatopsis sp. 195334CR TaxID=2814588 RepID=UPI0035AC2570
MTRLLETARQFQGRGREDAAGTTSVITPEVELSRRERQVAELVVEGLTYKQVGAQLYIRQTVEHHRRLVPPRSLVGRVRRWPLTRPSAVWRTQALDSARRQRDGGLTYGLITVTVDGSGTALAAAARGISLGLPTPAVMEFLLRMAALMAICTILGAAFGVLLRNQVTAMTAFGEGGQMLRCS